ncbi:Protein of unknown function DUF4817 [Trinorchestia longiramus]|nr:Protein of unknown function DUF4817 [Trinorchestia longiramus]
MPRSGEYRSCAVRKYLENGHSVVATQRAYRLHFNIPCHGPIPDGKAIRSWVEALEDTSSTRRPRGSGRPITVRTPENVALVQVAVEEYPRRSTRKHSLALAMSNRYLRRILRYDLSFHPYKITIVQELKLTDFENRRNCCQELLNCIPEPSTFFSRSVLGPLFIIIYINDLDIGIISKINKFADVTKLCHKAFIEMDRVTIQSDLNRLLQWTKTCHTSFNINKCSVMRLDANNQHFQHMMNDIPIETVH